MGLYDEITNDISDAFNTDLADAVKTAVYNSIVFSPPSADGSVIETITPHNTRGVLSYYTSKEVGASQGAIIRGDSNFLVLNDDLPVSPKLDDRIVVDGQEYKIIDFTNDPADVTHTFQLRSSGNG